MISLNVTWISFEVNAILYSSKNYIKEMCDICRVNLIFITPINFSIKIRKFITTTFKYKTFVVILHFRCIWCISSLSCAHSFQTNFKLKIKWVCVGAGACTCINLRCRFANLFHSLHELFLRRIVAWNNCLLEESSLGRIFFRFSNFRLDGPGWIVPCYSSV